MTDFPLLSQEFLLRPAGQLQNWKTTSTEAHAPCQVHFQVVLSTQKLQRIYLNIQPEISR